MSCVLPTPSPNQGDVDISKQGMDNPAYQPDQLVPTNSTATVRPPTAQPKTTNPTPTQPPTTQTPTITTTKAITPTVTESTITVTTTPATPGDSANIFFYTSHFAHPI